MAKIKSVVEESLSGAIERTLTHVSIRRRPSPAARRLLLERAANRCSFPGCNIDLIDSNGVPFAEICNIEAYSPGGPRFNAARVSGARASLVSDIDNLIVLCPTHHRLVDGRPAEYTVNWLKSVRQNHENSFLAMVNAKPDYVSLAKKLTTFHECIATWQANGSNGDEEFWHQIFKNHPKIIAQAVPNCVVQIAEKSYVGGKGVSNSGGKIVDFLYATKITRNVVVVEIKTPVTKLVGMEYRTGIFAISEELTGAIVQALTYRNQLVKNFHSLKNASPEVDFEVFDPVCMIIAGNFELEKLSSAQRASFDLFRANAGVTIVTYDELFAKIHDLVEMIDD